MAANPRTVVVLANGSVVNLEPWQHTVPAVLEGWLGGQAGGAAVADLLTGVANPSGKLAETVPVHYRDNPTVGNFPGEHGHVRYGEGLLIGYRWYDAHSLPVAAAFGHGLSYTTFGYSDLRVETRGNGVDVRVTITNTGDVAGSEVVQVYVADVDATVFRPDAELKGFARVTLEPGEAREVAVELDERAFSFWHSATGRWVVEGGEFGIRVGASSRDVRLATTVTLPGDGVTVPLQLDSELEVWLQHPDAAAAVRERIDGTPGRACCSTRSTAP